MTKRWKDMTDEEKRVLSNAMTQARRGVTLLIQAYESQGIEAVRDALSALAEALPEDVMGGYAD